ncbi:glycosyltransferase family protein [Mucilaginibacter glaciei]|uniref:Glycosyltransferase involved in cell wall biosynthesis n=1 Tax=Mucilaginibacter glaciei TaxID=2772109 RepID=A0A926NRC6_9SPHI|nr:glycosyltransferase [Mucilaginibacter glaciei]MBD1393305.1 hypothetical protein [Mucilaginibacter glaciei]
MGTTSTILQLTFLCSGLEPGRDGVGDYTRRLAAALIKQGHHCTVIAFNDRYISADEQSKQIVDDTEVSIFRIAAAQPAQQRFAAVKAHVQQFDPQWISLQFVPFGFHAKGLTFGLSKLLLSISKTAQWHLMVHELWVGMDKQSPAKHIAWGWLQKQLIRSLFRKLNPAVIATQSLLYQNQLGKMGFDASYLPLFSNIPVSGVKRSRSDRTVYLIIFGNIHFGAPVKQFAAEVAAHGQSAKIKYILKIVGHCGDEQAVWLKEWKSTGMDAELVGQQSPDRISAELINADIAITTTPVTITDKSGSFAAMREHDLPVISVSRPWHANGFEKMAVPDGVFYYQKGNFKEFLNRAANRQHAKSNVDVLAKQLSSLLYHI